MVHELEGIIDHLGIIHGGRLILEENFEVVKKRAKKIRLTFDGPASGDFKINGILAKQTDGKSCDLVFYPWDEEKRSELEAFHPKRIDVESMTLEEIFIHFVS
jgi:ABC-2 type transport system ATP-binding protein